MCRYVTIANKKQLVRDLVTLTSVNVSVAIQIVWEICPDALIVRFFLAPFPQISQEIVEMDSDKISKYAYYILSSFLNSVKRGEAPQLDLSSLSPPAAPNPPPLSASSPPFGVCSQTVALLSALRTLLFSGRLFRGFGGFFRGFGGFF